MKATLTNPAAVSPPMSVQPPEAAGMAGDQQELPDRRNSVVDRRSGVDRRAGGRERRVGMDRRRGPGRRLGALRREAEEGRLAGELLEFINAIDEYKKINDRPFPSWSEVFEIIHFLGYRKVTDKAGHINEACGPETYDGFRSSDPDAEAGEDEEDAES
ncbi:MAG: hypothetical protein HS102_05680 [Planctomycetia bacterium]|nr:hypothetical protein [Planctomycetia bacterium]